MATKRIVRKSVEESWTNFLTESGDRERPTICIATLGTANGDLRGAWRLYLQHLPRDRTIVRRKSAPSLGDWSRRYNICAGCNGERISGRFSGVYAVAMIATLSTSWVELATREIEKKILSLASDVGCDPCRPLKNDVSFSTINGVRFSTVFGVTWGEVGSPARRCVRAAGASTPE